MGKAASNGWIRMDYRSCARGCVDVAINETITKRKNTHQQMRQPRRNFFTKLKWIITKTLVRVCCFFSFAAFCFLPFLLFGMSVSASVCVIIYFHFFPLWTVKVEANTCNAEVNATQYVFFLFRIAKQSCLTLSPARIWSEKKNCRSDAFFMSFAAGAPYC